MDTTIDRVLTIGDCEGYTMSMLGFGSYQCPALGLYGYANDLQLARAIRLKLKQRAYHAKRRLDGRKG